MVAEDGGAIGLREDRSGDVLADLAAVDVPGGDELDVLGPVAAEVPVHQPDLVVGAAILIMGEALHERARAIADADDGDVDRLGVVEAHQAVAAWRSGRLGAERAPSAGAEV